MIERDKKYWDSSCFICFLNEDETERRSICEDVLKEARNGEFEIWTSAFTIVEVIRPKRHGAAPLPEWANEAIEAIEKDFPDARKEMETLWKRYQASDPATKLTPEQIDVISGMFEWDFIKIIDLDKRVADKAVELARDYGLRPADAIHAASAITAKIPVLQAWDRDFSKVNHLITVEKPEYLTAQRALFEQVGPVPEDFVDGQKEKHETEANTLSANEVRGSLGSNATGQTGDGIEETLGEFDEDFQKPLGSADDLSELQKRIYSKEEPEDNVE